MEKDYGGNARKRVDNKTGYKGIKPVGDKFVAVLAKAHLGTYESREEAHDAYRQASILKYGEYACFN